MSGFTHNLGGFWSDFVSTVTGAAKDAVGVVVGPGSITSSVLGDPVFMSLVKTGLTVTGNPEIAQALNLPIERVTAILDELESKLFFLVRNAQGNVAWAFPVTIEPTPHRLMFDSGEKLFAA